MATNRPFARNLATDPLILGTEQIGNLAIGIPTIGFTATGLDWYGGPDEELGYVIGKDNPDGQQAAVAPGDPPITAYLGFWRSDALTDESFISFGNDLLGANHATAAEVKTALNTAGYWTSYESATPPPPTGLPYTLDVINSDIFRAPATGKIAMADSSFNNTTNPDGLSTINISLTDGDGIDQTAIYQAWFNSIPAYGSGITNNATVTLTQGALTATYNMPDQMYSQNSYVFIISTSYISIYGGSEFDLAQTVLAGASFNSTDPITVTLVPNTL